MAVGGIAVLVVSCDDGAVEPALPAAPVATTVTVTPASAALTALEDTVRLTAEVRDQNGQVIAAAPVAWASSDASVASVDASGLVTAAANGSAAITATAGSVSGTGAVTVAQVVSAVTVSPDAAVVMEGDTIRVTAAATDANGHAVAGTKLVWTSSDTLVARVDSTGLVTGVSSGEVSITAASAEHTGRAQLIVVEYLEDRAALVAVYEATDGPNWGDNTNWLTDAPLGEWYGVESDASGRIVRLELDRNKLFGTIPPELGSLANLSDLRLANNQLTGTIPPELGNLSNLELLWISSNELTGAIPRHLLQIVNLTWIGFSRNAGLCAPGTAGFVAWLEGIEQTYGPLCNEADVAALATLHERVGGDRWTRSDGWLADAALAQWYGIEADSLGRVVTLDLARNGLAGNFPASLGQLTEMTELRVGDNTNLAGRLPLSLASLPLRVLDYSGTGVCAPDDASFQAWLVAIPSHEGTGTECPPLSDRETLEMLYDATGGPTWNNKDNWLTDASLTSWYGVSTGSDGRVTHLRMLQNGMTGAMPAELGNLTRLEELSFGQNWELSGQIPAEFGNLARLERLHLQFTAITGPIPAELGRLSDLTDLYIWRTGLSGPIPPELGNLTNLTSMALGENELSGPIPPELGNLTKLEWLLLVRNALTGPVPPELGNLTSLEHLSLDQNELTGSIPPELGQLTGLRAFGVANNATMSGALPASLTALRELDEFSAAGTGLCAPSSRAFEDWLAGIQKRRIASCDSGDAAAAYLVQTVQSHDFPVPLVAGERAALRVFPTAQRATTVGIPAVRARFYLDGREVHVENIPAGATPIPTEAYEGDLSESANAVIPGHIVQPGLEMVIEVDPDGTLDSALGVTRRIPNTGRATVDVRAMPTLDLTVVPFLWATNPDSSILHLATGMAADPESHEMLRETRTLLPVGVLDVQAHEPVLTDHNRSVSLGELEAIRLMEGGGGHYLALMSRRRETGSIIGYASGNRLSASKPVSSAIAHELGHNMSLDHAPCGNAAGLDRGYPYSDGSSGSWGYDHEGGGVLVHPSRPDLMSYCGPRWISDYHFTNALRYRLVDEVAPAAMAAGNVTRGLLLWGGIDADTVPYLEPAFVVDAPPALPDSAGDYRIIGRTGVGRELFSLSFGMPRTFDGDGRSSFAFVLPVRAGWEGNLAALTLTGPGGSFTLDGDSDLRMAILRNARTGQVRGFLRRPPSPTLAAAMDATGQFAGARLEVLLSRGIPDADAWRH